MTREQLLLWLEEDLYARGWAAEAEAVRAAVEALQLIAAPRRADGTYNRSREACEQLAKEALGE